MCLAILKPAKATLPTAHIRNGWISNPDGGGYGFVRDGKVVIRKGFSKLKEFEEAYVADSEQYKDSPFLVHFRICTMGTRGEDNTHPFPIDDGILIHNGTITGTKAVYGQGKSDTALFAEQFSKDLTFDFIMKNKTELNSSLTYNKVAILYTDKRYAIINEGDGYWVDDVWYSNKSYAPRASGMPAGWYDEEEWDYRG